METNDTLSAAPPEAPAETETEAPTAPAARPRPRGGTALLIAAAALIGISGGTAVGYGIQAERPPTPLPALSQAELAYPAKALPADKVPAPLPASQDRQVKTDGDLRKLLLPEPKGFQKSDDLWLQDGWMDLADDARLFEDEAYMYEELLGADFRRAAGASWEKGNRVVNVTLVQFRSGDQLGAVGHAESQLSYMGESDIGAGNEGDPIKGSGNGRYYLYKVHNEAGYLPMYRARAVAQRGDVMMEINLFDTKPLGKKDIRSMAERQLGLL
ncbi:MULTISPECIES: hypothetical protein [Streptomyces]|uniref:Serine/threonine protein kinase n=1 Tax=Streptomyces glycanivorans TaxID=3033808 RepID=A0ABY9JBC0_9ACTN|nr:MULTISPECIES: hypothetical protein [unclassified Streptomyces]WSQ78466.1 hypothetical protein OG725_15675 [Streptomyces sp. NBC_01213]TXS16852.1 hypothetical protein EAO68_02820 [Streptomyces sp. wa22]WLQ65088.1 hypothetical protein P8A20_16425 [Streptomyces sp. Alt3]WSQ85864.1 hypothetical protein OG722_16470 [Streptomyces sp. NBC_01212]WSR08064.1 hypothetical protein OG265_19640 [Streptomyces sp. NBC_01208]